MGKKILIAGESWSSTTIHTKGFDSFVTSMYAEGIQWLENAFSNGGYTVDFMPNHYAAVKFPYTIEEIDKYDVVLLSDIGTNTLLISPDTFNQGKRFPNRCELIKRYVEAGGGLCMVGGYMTFTGIDARGRWGSTPVKDVLPVKLLPYDDRVESPHGAAAKIVDRDHPVVKGLPDEWPVLLGFNKVIEDTSLGKVIATIDGEPLIACGEFKKGRSVAFTSDCSPHWAPLEFCNWEYYGKLWCNIADWLCKAAG
ncbi:MAG: glutamine amidotransferase [Treponema sp.]|jgi:uncharacterized membrane protein|nr:glutamine amidotransferase [Treponema sp.]